MTPFRTSPFAPVWRKAATRLASQHGMDVPVECGPREAEHRRARVLGIADVSGLPRSVVKGPGAAEFVAAAGFTDAGEWYAPSRRGAFDACVRTGTAEYTLEGAVPAPSAGLAHYPRQEASLLLAGSALPDVLEELVPMPLPFDVPRLVPTLFGRLPCTVLTRSAGETPALQLWVDATYAVYLGQVLTELAAEASGGWVGPSALSGLAELPPDPDLWRQSWT